MPCVLAVVAAFAPASVVAAGPPPEESAFAGPPAAYSPPIPGAVPTAGRVLRTISVEERANVARDGDLVRVPLFFAENECAALEDLAIVPASSGPGGAGVPWQADDVRRGPDGGIARAHLWFAIHLAAGEKRGYLLVRRPPGAAPPGGAAVPVAVSGDGIRVTTAAGGYVFTRQGALRAVPGRGGGWEFTADGAAPRVVVVDAGGPGRPRRIELNAAAAPPRVRWASGPLFAKIVVTYPAGGGAALAQVFRIPRDGRELVVTTTLFPGAGSGDVKQNQLLAGRLATGPAPRFLGVPAGMVHSLRAEQAYTVTALERPDAGAALLAVPLVLGGGNGRWSAGTGGAVVLQGPDGLQRGGEGEKNTLYAYWTQVRLVPAAADSPEALWRVYREHAQPLVAVVDEPGAGVDELHAALMALMWEMKPIGWRQEAGRELAAGQTSRLAGLLKGVSLRREGDATSLVEGARYDTARITDHGRRKLREDEKGRAYGRLDPYDITYTQSAAAAVVALVDTPPAVNAVDYAMALGVREFGGRIDPAGFPYIDCFNRALNMQLGPVLFGLTAGAREGDDGLVRFYRDLATAPPLLAVFGRGQRPYTGAPTRTPDQTDFLYQAISDFWLRTTELLANENLHLHPLAYGRYTDCIDVMADRYHGVAARDQPGAPGEVRANFFRGQAHTHRWLGWSCAPFIRLLQDPAEHSAIGITEAIRYAQTLKGRWKNWPDLTFYELADLLVRDGLARYRPPPQIAGPARVTVVHGSGGADVAWEPVPGAKEYRVYRADSPGGPYTWIDSPYLEHPVSMAAGTRVHDPDAKSNSTYIVLAADAEGRTSDWPDTP